MKTITAFIALIAASVSNTAVHAATPTLLVHEWGTFTSFQDSEGATIDGINVDDEPVPKFVHRLHEVPIFTTHSTPAVWSQGAPGCHPDVTLRLETPVLYFYPQTGFSAASFDVRATFVGGWLTEFFPFADAENSGFPGELAASTRGSLQWKTLRLATDLKGIPQTQEHVWTAPRAVHSAVVTEGRKQEAEKYLFYRGVGHLDAPLVIREMNGSLDIMPRRGDFRPFPELWVIRVHPDGRVRFTHMPAGEQGAERVMIPEGDPSAPSDLDELRRQLADALVAHGLYEEEALAMLETWELSYFESEGMRLMFVLPRSWIDAHLPLAISTPADITRVMLGRIELVSPHQRAKLRRLQELPATAFDIKPLYSENPTVLLNMQAGTASHAELYRSVGREVPEALRLYDSLGRFRDALLVHEWKSTRDVAARTRLKVILRTFGACTSRFTES
jgi:hypothetical protein